MKYRRFGRTGLDVSEIVFGGGYVGGALILADDDTKRAMIRRSQDALYFPHVIPRCPPN